MFEDIVQLLSALGALLPLVQHMLPTWFAPYAKWWTLAGVLILFTVPLVRIVGSMFGRRQIRLIYKKRSGVLFDSRIGEINVSLRRDSLEEILNACPLANLRAVGRGIGRNFWETFRDHYMRRGTFLNWPRRAVIWFRQHIVPTLAKVLPGVRQTSKEKELARVWAAYDSSAGMGRFEVEGLGIDLQGTLTVKNCFTAPSGKCEFVAGYIEGVLHEMTGQEFKVTHGTGHRADQEGFQLCEFTVHR